MRMNLQNDFSYEADGKVIVIGEHQATINFNMPLRSLMYIGRIYEQLVPVRERYKKGQVMLPKPEFYTFELAIKECIKKGILADYLSKKGSEVINMLQAEYDYELDIEVQREEAYEDGLRAGEKTGKLEEKISLIVKKVRRGKDLETIAEELEESVENIREIYEAVQKSAPDYNMDTICKSLD